MTFPVGITGRLNRVRACQGYADEGRLHSVEWVRRSSPGVCLRAGVRILRMKTKLIIAAIAAYVLSLTVPNVSGESKPVQHIDISASRFSFEPHEITVKKGEPVILSVHSNDVTHGLVIEELGIRTEVKKGESEDLKITPETAGTFEGTCAHFCGKGHGSMTLV